MQPSRPDQLPAVADGGWEKRPAREALRFLATMGVAMLVSLPTSRADANEAQATTQEGSSLEVPVAPIVIESDAPNPPLGEDQLMAKFRNALGAPRDSRIAEHQFANGPLEITTPFARLCVEPAPARLESGLGGQIGLAAPCAVF